MKTLGVMQAIALVGEAFVWGPIFGGIGAGIGFVVADGDVWIAWGLLGFSLGILYRRASSSREDGVHQQRVVPRQRPSWNAWRLQVGIGERWELDTPVRI